MNRKIQFLGGLFALLFITALITTSCADPRKNCNHPQHGVYMKEKMMKKRGV